MLRYNININLNDRTSYMQTATPLPCREARMGHTPEALTEIYDPACNLAVWQRSLSDEIRHYLRQCEQSGRSLSAKTLFSCQGDMLEEVRNTLNSTLPQGQGREALIEDILQLMEMYACLFEPQSIGLRLATLQHAMCPGFHVDHLPARLVTCYQGTGTQWLPEPATGQPRIPAQEPERFEQLNAGDVALLKGEGWYDNEGFGIVHRSPPVPAGQTRLFLSLDWAD